MVLASQSNNILNAVAQGARREEPKYVLLYNVL